VNQFAAPFRLFLFSTSWDFELVIVSVAADSFDGLRCPPDIISSCLRLVGGGCDFTNFPGDEGRPNFGIFFGGSGVLAASFVSDSLSAPASSFLTSLAAIDRAFAALCFRRLVFISSNLAICIRVYMRQRSKGATEIEV